MQSLLNEIHAIESNYVMETMERSQSPNHERLEATKLLSIPTQWETMESMDTKPVEQTVLLEDPIPHQVLPMDFLESKREEGTTIPQQNEPLQLLKNPERLAPNTNIQKLEVNGIKGETATYEDGQEFTIWFRKTIPYKIISDTAFGPPNGTTFGLASTPVSRSVFGDRYKRKSGRFDISFHQHHSGPEQN